MKPADWSGFLETHKKSGKGVVCLTYLITALKQPPSMQHVLVGRQVLTRQVFNLSTPTYFDIPRKLSTWTSNTSFLPQAWWKAFGYGHQPSRSEGVKGCSTTSLSLLPGKNHASHGVRNLPITFLPPHHSSIRRKSLKESFTSHPSPHSSMYANNQTAILQRGGCRAAALYSEARLSGLGPSPQFKHR